jgi:hypothetical protein
MGKVGGIMNGDVDLFGDIVEVKCHKMSHQDRIAEWEWCGMPEFIQENQEPYAKIIFRFEDEGDLLEFAELIQQKLTKSTKSAWFPFRSHWGARKFIWDED